MHLRPRLPSSTPACPPLSRTLSFSAPALLPPKLKYSKGAAGAYDIRSLEQFAGDDTTAEGHMVLEARRKWLDYMRRAEYELPLLEVHRVPFVPPSPKQTLAIRTLSYMGAQHPAGRKASLTTAISSLPLKSAAAKHKFKVLAGARWSGPLRPEEGKGLWHGKGDEDGTIKIACEEFPERAMNVKWCADVLERLVEAANDQTESFADIPLDTRHIDAHKRRAGDGRHRLADLARPGGGRRPSLARDFPKRWLPEGAEYVGA